MKKVAIVTDTCGAMPQDMAERYGIQLVPRQVTVSGVSYLETEISLAEFYARLKEAQNPPTTGSPPPGAFLEAFRKQSKMGEAILCVTMTLGFVPAEYQAIMQAKEMALNELPETTIEIVDSRSVCGGQLLVVLEAAKAAAAGKSLDAVTEIATNIVSGVSTIYVLDTLYYLAAGGRIGKARDWSESTLSLKPILEIDASTDGVVKPLERFRTKSKAVERLLEIAKERNGNRRLHAVISHSNVPDEAEELKKQLLSQFECAELYVTDVWPMVGVENGPGCLWLGFYSED